MFDRYELEMEFSCEDITILEIGFEKAKLFEISEFVISKDPSRSTATTPLSRAKLLKTEQLSNFNLASE